MDIERDLIAASSAPIALAAAADEESHGYAMLQRVREVSGGSPAWGDGMFYPVLHRLERLGHLGSRWGTAENGRRRKYYRITARGRALVRLRGERPGDEGAPTPAAPTGRSR